MNILTKITGFFKYHLFNIFFLNLIFAPLLGVFLDNEILLYYTVFCYSVLNYFSIAYLIGSIRCSDEIAFNVMLEKKYSPKSIITYLPLLVVGILSLYASIYDHYLISIYMIISFFINAVSTQIIRYKSNKHRGI